MPLVTLYIQLSKTAHSSVAEVKDALIFLRHQSCKRTGRFHLIRDSASRKRSNTLTGITHQIGLELHMEKGKRRQPFRLNLPPRISVRDQGQTIEHGCPNLFHMGVMLSASWTGRLVECFPGRRNDG